MTVADAETGRPDWSIANNVFPRRRFNPSYSNTVKIAIRGASKAREGAAFDADAYTAAEGGAAAVVTVTLKPRPSAPVQIPLALKSYQGGATAADHSALPATLNFAAMENRKAFTVTATDDAINDDGESLTLGFGDLPEGYAAGAAATATVSLADDEETVSFGADTYTATEGGTAARVTVTLSAAPSAPVEVALTATRNGATAAADYSGIPAMLSFAAMETRKAFTVTATDDAVDDDGESVTLGLDRLPGNYGRGAVPETTVSLADNDAPRALDGRVAAAADTDYAFSAADFGFAGVDDAGGLASVKIVFLSGRGELRLNGTAIAAADLPKTVTRADLDAGTLVYVPPAGESGEFLSDFTFRVNDGTSDSALTYVMIIDVDAPPGMSLVSNLRQSASTGSAASSLDSIDVAQGFETGSRTGGYTLTSVELRLSAVPGGLNAVPIVTLVAGSPDATGGVPLTTTSSVVGLSSRTYEFTAPAGTTLDASSKYYIVVESPPRGYGKLGTS